MSAINFRSFDTKAAHKRCIHHRAEIDASDLCGCFYCLDAFSATDIIEWVDGDQTALCPRCGIDSVIGSASGYPIDKHFLLQMHDRFF
jgi:hypothetical protein